MEIEIFHITVRMMVIAFWGSSKPLNRSQRIRLVHLHDRFQHKPSLHGTMGRSCFFCPALYHVSMHSSLSSHVPCVHALFLVQLCTMCPCTLLYPALYHVATHSFLSSSVLHVHALFLVQPCTTCPCTPVLYHVSIHSSLSNPVPRVHALFLVQPCTMCPHSLPCSAVYHTLFTSQNALAASEINHWQSHWN